MKEREFKFGIPDYDFYLRIQVYKTVDEMVKGASKYAVKNGGLPLSDDAEAVFFGVRRDKQKNVFNKEKVRWEREIGKIFLCKEFLNYSSIVHECFHASYHFFRENMGHIGNSNSFYAEQDEEFLNCIFTDLFNYATEILHKNKYVIKDEMLETIKELNNKVKKG